MEFEIYFYKDNEDKNPIEEFVLELGKRNRLLAAKTKQGIEKLRNRAYHKEPLSKYLEPELWEIRIKAGTDILRIIYTFILRKLSFVISFLSIDPSNPFFRPVGLQTGVRWV